MAESRAGGAGVAETAEFIRQAIAHRPTDATAYSIVKHNLQDAVDAVVDKVRADDVAVLVRAAAIIKVLAARPVVKERQLVRQPAVKPPPLGLVDARRRTSH